MTDATVRPRRCRDIPKAGRPLRAVLAVLLGLVLVTTAVPTAALAAPAVPAASTSGTSGTDGTTGTGTAAAGDATGASSRAACSGVPAVGMMDDLGSFDLYVEWMVRECLTQGYSDSTFRVQRSITRAEAVSFLYRMSGETYQGGAGSDFPDVKKDDAHYDAVMWAQGQGIATGYSDGSFGRNREIDRGELAAMMYRHAGRPSVDLSGQPPFPDLFDREDRYYYAPAVWMHSLGVTGYLDRTFRPERDVNRGETTKFLYLVNGVTGDVPPLSLWTETGVDLYAQDDWRNATVLSSLKPQTGVEWIRDSELLAQVRVNGTTGWVNKVMLNPGRPGTSAKPYPHARTFEQKVANNIAPWCWKPEIVPVPGKTSYANMQFQYRSYGNRILVDKREDLQITSDIPDPDHVSSKAVQLHECAHLLQYRAYGYLDAVRQNGQELSAMDRDLNRIYQSESTSGQAITGTAGAEHMADCMADAMGAQRVTDEYIVGYKGECTPTHLDAAKQLIAGERFSEPTVLNATDPQRRAVPFSEWQKVSRPDVPVQAKAGHRVWKF